MEEIMSLMSLQGKITEEHAKEIKRILEDYKKTLVHNEEVSSIEDKQKFLTDYSKWLEKHGYLDSDWWSEGNTVNEFLNIK